MTAPTVEIGTEARELAERVKAAAGERYIFVDITARVRVDVGSTAWEAMFGHVGYIGGSVSVADVLTGTGDTPLAALKAAIAKSPWAGEVL